MSTLIKKPFIAILALVLAVALAASTSLAGETTPRKKKADPPAAKRVEGKTEAPESTLPEIGPLAPVTGNLNEQLWGKTAKGFLDGLYSGLPKWLFEDRKMPPGYGVMKPAEAPKRAVDAEKTCSPRPKKTEASKDSPGGEKTTKAPEPKTDKVKTVTAVSKQKDDVAKSPASGDKRKETSARGKVDKKTQDKQAPEEGLSEDWLKEILEGTAGFQAASAFPGAFQN